MLASDELAVSARNPINRAAALGRLRIAAISLWETALLARVAALFSAVPGTMDDASGIRSRAWQLSRCCRKSQSRRILYQTFHRDPADRLIVATARVTNATLMTRDRRILDYAARGHLTAIAA